jgi:hypothetical protein
MFRIRSGDDLFFDYDIDCPADALRQIVRAMGELPEKWKQMQFDEDGFAVVEGEEGKPFWNLEETRPLADRVRGIADEPAGPFINGRGDAFEVVDVDWNPEVAMFDDDGALRTPTRPRWAR